MFANNGRGGLATIPPVTRNLLIINVIIWVAEMIFPSLGNTLVKLLGLHFVAGSLFNPVQIFTYMFIHDPSSPVHIFFNMFSLWMFGRLMEQVWGSKRFLVYYFVCGVGAAFVQEAVWAGCWMNDYVSGIARLNGLTDVSMKEIVDEGIRNRDAGFLDAIAAYKNSMVTIGASGAIFGILLGFAFVFPNLPLYLFFIPVPIKAKYMVAGYAVIEFFLGVSHSVSTVAHFAHLGGMLFGLILLLWWRKNGTLRGGRF